MCNRYIDRFSLTCPHLGTWPATQACALTGNWTGDLLVHRPALHPLSHISQGSHGFSKHWTWSTNQGKMVLPSIWHFTNNCSLVRKNFSQVTKATHGTWWPASHQYCFAFAAVTPKTVLPWTQPGWPLATSLGLLQQPSPSNYTLKSILVFSKLISFYFFFIF